MGEFWDWMNEQVAKYSATLEGRTIVANGFTLEHTGGGNLAWEKNFSELQVFLMLTDDDGYPIPEPGKKWLISLCDKDEGELIELDSGIYMMAESESLVGILDRGRQMYLEYLQERSG